MTHNLWHSIVMQVGTKEYKFRHDYEELLSLFGIIMMYDAKGMILRLDNFGLVKVKQIEFHTENKLVLKCERV